MKLIHCGDLHLDSKMTAHLSPEKAKERKAELLQTYLRMVDYALHNDVKYILIAGDLFDTKKVSATASNTVLQSIVTHPELTFFYLRGNHDGNSFLTELDEVPENLRLFTDRWTTYTLTEAGKTLTVSGIEENSELLYSGLNLNPEHINIVMLHGQEGAGKNSDLIRLKDLRNKGIDYLALGHIHFYKKEALDNRGTYCYPGCLEPRGFDECGEHGFMLLDINLKDGTAESTFVPFSYRNFYEIPVDVSACMTSAEVYEAVRKAMAEAGYDSRHIIKILLQGERDYESELDTLFLEKQLEDAAYYCRIKDATTYHVDYHSFALDESLKGEFVRSVMEDENLTEEEKAYVVRQGIKALAGEVLD
ncbi:MAG: metallophosphoesterase [Lachnospiraceae bacterium]|nr:metallophosphoesterase [Lachnospiraceae bacterium]